MWISLHLKGVKVSSKLFPLTIGLGCVQLFLSGSPKKGSSLSTDETGKEEILYFLF